MSSTMIKIPDDLVKIKISSSGRNLTACLPDGTTIPAITQIIVKSVVGSLIKAEITVVADVRDIENYDELITKEVVVQHTVNSDELLKHVNSNKELLTEKLK